MKKKQRESAKAKGTEAKQQSNYNTELKMQEHKLRHERKRRRKEGEEKAHEDGGIGWMITPLRGWRLQYECAMPPLEVTMNSQDKIK